MNAPSVPFAFADHPQMSLDLTVPPRMGIEDFLVGNPNETAFNLLEAWPSWSDLVLRLEGEAGSGKSHLAAIWAHRTGTRIITAEHIRVDTIPAYLGSKALVIEQLDTEPRDEAALFHLLNEVRQRGIYVLLTSRTPPTQWGLKTADLLSRLRLAPVARITPPDENLFKAILVKLFLDRQLMIDLNIIEYLAVRLPNTFAQAQAAVIYLDQLALSRSRRVTRALASQYIQTLHSEEQDFF
jgi:chromosomal replication initiation ATPase DnaA